MEGLNMRSSNETDGARSTLVQRITPPRHVPGLRLAPLVDVVFLLLLFFIVVAKWRPQENFLPFQPTTAQAGQPILGRVEPLHVAIRAAEGGCDVEIAGAYRLAVRDATLDKNLAALVSNFAAVMSEQRRLAGDPMEITCESAVKWRYLARIYDLLYAGGMTDITFNMTEASQ